MADFKKAFEKTLKWEGGSVLHEVAGDPGGVTYAGISRRRHPDWDGWWRIDAGDTVSDALHERVAEFYREAFWDRMSADKIPFQSVAEAIFDFAVNAGAEAAVRVLQRTLDVEPVDGIVGPITLAALSAAYPFTFLADYTLDRIRYYAELTERRPDLRKFFRGWVNRALAFGPKEM